MSWAGRTGKEEGGGEHNVCVCVEVGGGGRIGERLVHSTVGEGLQYAWKNPVHS